MTQFSFCAAGTLMMILITSGTAEAADVKNSILTYDALPRTAPEPRTDSCLLLSHDCEVCALNNGEIVCSSIGIACEPTERRCYHYADKPK